MFRCICSSNLFCCSPLRSSAELHVRKIRTVVKGSSSGAGGPANSTVVRSAEEKTAEYAVFALVPIFCVMGLLGILICNILKKKGYNCTAEKDGRDEETATHQKEEHETECLNNKTCSCLFLFHYHCIMHLLFPMLSPLSTFRSIPKSCPHQSHLHTISGLSGLAPKHGYRCSRCAQRKWPPVLIPPLDSFKDPMKPPQSLILPSLDTPVDQQKNPLPGRVCVDTHRTQAAVVPKTVQSKVDSNDGREKKEGEVLSVGRPIAIETKASSQEQRNSLFGGKHFPSCSSSGFKRYGPEN
ncbi:hypothetical protein GOODEAATRI_016048 [Goodea atripinnis]|uniref:RELT TNF receptor n=1 Tax=Goodea atripinnis TaxID=208336 RepID=A0ABV0NKP7_9TELE